MASFLFSHSIADSASLLSLMLIMQEPGPTNSSGSFSPDTRDAHLRVYHRPLQCVSEVERLTPDLRHRPLRFDVGLLSSLLRPHSYVKGNA